jgi:uncharacterized protein YndB with AHSA1/START domain
MDVELIAQELFRAPPEAVFALAIDPERFPAMFVGFGPVPALRRIELHAPAAVGSTRDVEGADGARMLERITALDPPRHHAYVLSRLRPPLSWLAREALADWRFSAHGGGTQVCWTYRFALTSPLAWAIAYPILRIFMQGAMQRCLGRMARTLDAQAGAAR